MNETQVNGTRVVFRETFSARHGWGLLPVVRRIDKARVAAASEAEDDVDFMGLVLETLAYEEIVTFVQGAVAEWDFDGDLSQPDCCDDLDPLNELLTLATQAVLLFYANRRALGE